MPKTKKMNSIIRDCYSMQQKSADEYDITMYGEIVSARPKDWRTGEYIEGDFIVQREFIKDLESVVESGAKKINLRINSLGGSSAVSITLHNRIRELIAEGVEFTARIDGVAMSGASMIMCACDKVEVNPSSLIMIHKCWSFLFGAYNADELRQEAEHFDAYDKAAAAIYHRKTGISETVLMHMMSDTTFMTGSEAKEKGFADVLIEDAEPIEIAASADRSVIYVSGRKMPLMGAVAPESIPTITTPKEEVINKSVSGNTPDEKGGNSMATNLAELRAENPELAEQIEAEVRAALQSEMPNENEIRQQERQRMQEIDEIAGTLAPELVSKAKYEEPCSAAELAYKAMLEQAKTGKAFLKSIKDDYEASGAADVGAAPREEDPAPKTHEQMQAEARAAVASIGRKE